MTMRITFKNSDAIDYAISDYVRDVLGLTEKEEIDEKSDEIHSEISQWFKYSEYLTVEYDFNTKQMVVVKQ